jgi:hypothetical protein
MYALSMCSLIVQKQLCYSTPPMCADNYIGGYEPRDRLLFVGALIDTQCDELWREACRDDVGLLEKTTLAIDNESI